MSNVIDTSTQRSLLQDHVFTSESGETIRQFIDSDGVIIDELRLEQRWIRGDQYVYVGDTGDEEYGSERSLGRNPEHIKLYRTNIQHILGKMTLSKDARCAFLSCIAFLDWNSNFVVDPVTQEPLSGREIADRTLLDKMVMSRGLRELQAHGIIAVMSSGQRKQSYVMHPSVAWKGRRVARDIAQVKHFDDNGLDLPVTIKYSAGAKVR